MQTISANDAKVHFSEVLRRVREQNTTYTVTLRGEPVARISAIEDDEVRIKARAQAAFQRMLEIRQHVKPRQLGDPTIREMIDAGRP